MLYNYYHINIQSFMIFLTLTSVGNCQKCLYKIETILTPDLCLSLDDDKLQLSLDVKKIFPLDKAAQSRHDHEEVQEKKPNIIQRFAAILMMVPLVMQLLSLPGALASIKLSLLKSFFVGKLALIIMLYNLLKTLRPTPEVVVVHHPQPPQQYQHYYHPFDDEDTNHGWFG